MESTIGIESRAAAARELAHPERMRIFSALHRNPMSRLELAAVLDDISATSLHRHLIRLHDAGLIHVVTERSRGSNLERVFEARPLDLTPTESAELSPDDYLTIVTSMASDLVTAVQRAATSNRGLVGRSTFGVQVFYATDDEHTRIVERFDAFLAEIDIDFVPGPNRTRRTLSYGLCPREP